MGLWTPSILLLTLFCLGVRCQTTAFPPGTTLQCTPADEENDDNTGDPQILGANETTTITSHAAYDGTTIYPDESQNYNCRNKICMDPALINADPQEYELVLYLDPDDFDVSQGGNGKGPCGKDRVSFYGIVDTAEISDGDFYCTNADGDPIVASTVELVADEDGCIEVRTRLNDDDDFGTGWTFDVEVRLIGS